MNRHLKLVKIIFLNCLITAELGWTQSSSSLQISSSSQSLSSSASSKMGATAQVLTWPLRRVLQPMATSLLWPIYPPLKYIDDENVIDKAMDLATWGPNNKITTIPVVFPLGRNDSYIGVRNIMNELIAKKLRNSQYLKYYVSGDYSLMTDFAYLWDDFYVKSQFQKNHFLKKVLYPLEIDHLNQFQYPKHTDYTFYFQNQVFYNLSHNWSMNLGVDYNMFRYVTNPHVYQDANPVLVDNLKRRGFYDDYEEVPLTFGFGFDSRESQFTPTYGTKFNLSSTYAFARGFGNYMNVKGDFQNYKLLGGSSYKITREEDKKRIRNLMRFKMNEAIPFLSVDDFKNTLLNRRVLVSSFKFKQAFDAQDQPMTITGLSSLGQNTPLRAYAQNRFMSYGYFAWGHEYRWPVIRRIDGVLFNEYGVFYNNPLKLDQWKLRNSWGLGLRVSNPDFYFTRFQIAFHGLSGVSIILTTSPEID